MPLRNDQLHALVHLQDIDLMLREVRDPVIAKHEVRLGFAMENVGGLERVREKLASKIDDRLLQTYERMSTRFTRVVVAVEGSVCQGCRINLPTSSASRNATSTTFESCENCGRILYRL